MSGLVASPRVAVVVSHPIQYFTPLFTRLTQRARMDLTVVYGNDAGLRPAFDAGFGREVTWDLDLIGGHKHVFLSRGPRALGAVRPTGFMRLAGVLRRQDVVVVHGYSTPLTAAALLLCLIHRVPYLLRSDTSTLKRRAWWDPRRWWISLVVARSAAVLASGSRNAAVYGALGARRLVHAPFTVDVDRFRREADRAKADRDGLREGLGMPADAKVALFAGKLAEHKRPQDLAEALALTRHDVHALFIGDGPMASRVTSVAPESVTVAGFANQSEMPRLLAAGDVFVLPSSQEAWGLGVNEALACGLVPVVSEDVGCAPDLVEGTGVVYPTGDVRALAEAIDMALDKVGGAEFAQRQSEFLERYSMEACAAAYEEALSGCLRSR
jgi:glycosyltransferase involved in cell wall biosynthesis